MSILKRQKLLFTILFLSLVVVTQLNAFAFEPQQNFFAKGTIVYHGIGVYTDEGNTEPLTSILWGSIHPGSTVKQTLYVHNESPDLNDIAIVMNVTSWDPTEASNYLTVTSNYNGDLIAWNMSIPLELTLNVSYLITNIEAFSFTVSLSAITANA